MHSNILKQHPDATSYQQLLGRHQEVEWMFANAETLVRDMMATPGYDPKIIAEMTIRLDDLSLMQDCNSLVIGLLHDIIELEKATADCNVDPSDLRDIVKRAIAQAKSEDRLQAEIKAQQDEQDAINELIDMAQDYMAEHRKLWDWLAETGAKDKEDWDGWEFWATDSEPGDEATTNSCFACEIAHELNIYHNGDDLDDDCKYCPITWDNPGHPRFKTCTNGEYREWTHTGGEAGREIAKVIRDKEWTITIDGKDIPITLEDKDATAKADRAA